MKVSTIRQHLSKHEMERLTEQALSVGPFVVKKIVKLGSAKEVTVRFPEQGQTKVITL